MQNIKSLVSCMLLLLTLFSSRATRAADDTTRVSRWFPLLLLTLFSSRATRAADDTTRVLRELDSAALKFKTVIADFEWQGEQTAPFPDTETQTGTIYRSEEHT